MTLNMSMPDLMKNVTVEIVIQKPLVWSLRMWLATKLVQLASLVFPLKTDVRIEGKEVCTYAQEHRYETTAE